MAKIGELVEANGTTNVPTATGKAVVALKLTKGKYIVFASCYFDSNKNGYRQINIHLEAGYSSTSSRVAQSKIPAPTTGYAQMSTSNYVSVNSDKTLYLNASQNSGDELNCTGNLMAVRIA